MYSHQHWTALWELFPSINIQLFSDKPENSRSEEKRTILSYKLQKWRRLFCSSTEIVLFFFSFIYGWPLKVLDRKVLHEIKGEINSFLLDVVWVSPVFCLSGTSEELAPQSTWVVCVCVCIRSVWAGATDSREEYSPPSPWWSSAGRTACSETEGETDRSQSNCSPNHSIQSIWGKHSENTKHFSFRWSDRYWYPNILPIVAL